MSTDLDTGKQNQNNPNIYTLKATTFSLPFPGLSSYKHLSSPNPQPSLSLQVTPSPFSEAMAGGGCNWDTKVSLCCSLLLTLFLCSGVGPPQAAVCFGVYLLLIHRPQSLQGAVHTAGCVCVQVCVLHGMWSLGGGGMPAPTRSTSSSSHLAVPQLFLTLFVPSSCLCPFLNMFPQRCQQLCRWAQLCPAVVHF